MNLQAVFFSFLFYVQFFIRSYFVLGEKQLPRLDELYEKHSYPLKEPFVNFVRTIVHRQETTGVNLTSSCASDLKKLVTAIEDGQDEAMAMLDSFTHQRSGQENGVVIDTGHQTQCEGITFHGKASKYHLLQVTYPSPSVDEAQKQLPDIDKSSSWTHQLIWNSIGIRYTPKLFALCLPASCSQEDLTLVLGSPHFINLTYPLSLTVIGRQVSDDIFIKVIKILSYAIILLLITANLIASSCELSNSSILSHFNIRKNFRALIKPPSRASTQFISKIKLAYIHVSNVNHHNLPITYHSIFSTLRPFHMVLTNMEPVREIVSSASALISFNFIMSSILTFMTWYPILSKRKVNFTQFLMIRAVRSIPVVLFMTLIVIISDGFNVQSPLMRDWLDSSSSNCLKNGWLELTFLSNFADVNTLCHRVAWFASADMQLYTASFLLMVYLSKNQDHRRTIKWMVTILCICGILCLPFGYACARKIIMNMKYGLFFMEDPMRMVQSYFNTVQYLAPYVGGLWVGYYIATGYQVPRKWLGPLIALNISLSTCFILSLPMRPQSEFLVAILFVFRILTLTASNCVFFLWVWSRQNPDNKEITIIGYISTVVSRMQYPFFLIHPIVITYFSLNFGYQFYTYEQIFYMIYPLQLIVSFTLATIVHLTVESPFANLLTSSMRGKIKEQSKHKATQVK